MNKSHFTNSKMSCDQNRKVVTDHFIAFYFKSYASDWNKIDNAKDKQVIP